jgi:PAS domain S-box-containing protein
MKTISTNIRAIVISLVVFVTLLAGALFFWRNYTIPEMYREHVIMGLMLFCITLITILLYQSRKVYESARSIARGMTRSMLEESQELFSELYRNSPIPYIVVDGNGVVDSMNIATARFFHVELDALEGIEIFSLFDAEDDGDKTALVPEYYKKEKPVNEVEVRIRRPDGVERWVLLSLFPFRDAEGRRRGLLTLVDVTKQKKIDKAKTEFVSLASHQLRTPISAMKWNIELFSSASEGKLTKLQSEYLEKISHNVARMDLLIDDFLNVSKLELGTLTPEYVQIDLIPFIGGIQDEYSAIAEKKNVRIEIDWSQVNGVVISDSHLLHMIVSNLVGNAVKYTPAGGVVRVNARFDADHVVFTISDTGIGIPAEEQEMLFSKLFRATNAKGQAIEGTGLGLYVVQEAVHVLGGKITFVSSEGRGTSFTVVLPK